MPTDVISRLKIKLQNFDPLILDWIHWLDLTCATSHKDPREERTTQEATFMLNERRPWQSGQISLKTGVPYVKVTYLCVSSSCKKYILVTLKKNNKNAFLQLCRKCEKRPLKFTPKGDDQM